MPWPTDPNEPYFGLGLWAWVTNVWAKLTAEADGSLHTHITGHDGTIEVTQTTPADLTPGVYAWTGSAWVRLACEADGSLHTHITGHDSTILVQQYMPSLLQPGINGYDGSNWQKLSLLWGYTDRFAENLGGTKSGAGTYNKFTTAVPAGEVWIIEAVEAHNNTTNPSFVALYIYDGTTTFVLKVVSTPGIGVPTLVTGRWTLKAGDKVGFDVGGCVDSDAIAGFAWGYKMDVA